MDDIFQQAVDLSHPIGPDMPVYPGTDQPCLTHIAQIPSDGFQEKKILITSHTGTHLDAPAHILQGAKTLDLLPINRFYGTGICIGLKFLPGKFIEMEDLMPFKQQIHGNDFLLLNTGWSKYWGRKRYFRDYPVLSPAAADWLIQFDLKGVGMDTVSADLMNSHDYPIHKAFLGQDRLIIENLTNLDLLGAQRFLFVCFPLPLQDADGSPVRAVALLNDQRQK